MSDKAYSVPVAIENPLTPAEVCNRYLALPAYILHDDYVVVSKRNVSFMREKMAQHGNSEFQVKPA